MFEAELVIGRETQMLFASEVTFGGLNRHTSGGEIELDPIRCRQIAEPSASAPKVIRRSFSIPTALAACFTHREFEFHPTKRRHMPPDRFREIVFLCGLCCEFRV